MFDFSCTKLGKHNASYSLQFGWPCSIINYCCVEQVMFQVGDEGTNLDASNLTADCSASLVNLSTRMKSCSQESPTSSICSEPRIHKLTWSEQLYFLDKKVVSVISYNYDFKAY